MVSVDVKHHLYLLTAASSFLESPCSSRSSVIVRAAAYASDSGESLHCFLVGSNRRFPEITGKDNLTVFSSYSGRVKSPEWRRQRRRADLRHFEIFRHGAIIIYTRLPAGGTYYPICMFPTNSERLIGKSDAFSAFVYGYPSSCPRAHCTPNKSVPTLRYTRKHGAIPVGTYRGQSPGFPKIVY